jgi:hypothetical protein
MAGTELRPRTGEASTRQRLLIPAFVHLRPSPTRFLQPSFTGPAPSPWMARAPGLAGAPGLPRAPDTLGVIHPWTLTPLGSLHHGVPGPSGPGHPAAPGSGAGSPGGGA